MENYLQILAFIIIGIILLWFGYTLLSGQFTGIRLSWLEAQQKRKKSPPPRGSPGDPQVCPVCSTKLYKGSQVKSKAFPSLSGGRDRMMHIQGCVYCINGELPRSCPVCGASLDQNDILIARMSERPGRSHVHIMGCSKCKRV